MSKNGTKLLVQINERWKLETDGLHNVLILQLKDVNKEHHRAKEGGASTRWIERGWYGNLPSALEPLLHKMADAGQAATPEEARTVQNLMNVYADCSKQIQKALTQIKKAS